MEMRRPDPITNPLVVGNVDAGIIYSAIQPLDQIANEMECKWGVGRLERLVSVETAAKFGAAREKLNAAIEAQDADEVVKRSKVMCRAWQALDAEATAGGHRKIVAEVWVAEDDQGNLFSVVKTLADAIDLQKNGVTGAVYHLQEIGRIIAMFKRSAPVVQFAKGAFQNANIEAIRPTQDNFNDPIPF
jgi:hypothetical protein